MSGAQGPRASLLKRMALFVSKPYLEWNQTAGALSPAEDDALRSAFSTQRLHELHSTERNRDLRRLRLRLLRKPVSPYADGNVITSPMPRRPRQRAEPFEDFAATQPLRRELPTQPLGPRDGDIDVVTQDEDELSAVLSTAAFDFAAGDMQAAEAALLKGLEELPQSAAALYRHLLDLYRATQQQEKFAAAAHLLSRSTGQPAPLWERPRPAPAAAGPANELVLPRVVDAAQATRALNHVNTALNHGTGFALNFRAVRIVEDKACWPLAALLSRLADSADEVPVCGLRRLAQALAPQAGPQGASCDRFRALLALHRLSGDTTAYLEACDGFVKHCKLPAPDWTPPRCVLIQPARAGEQPVETTALGTHQIVLSGIVKAPALEELLKSQRDDLAHAHLVDIRCDRLRRLDFEAATTLANWAREQTQQGLVVQISELNHLHHRLLQCVGAADGAELLAHRRYET
jgi:ABC-type transporter Mla MlaB component